MRAEHLRALPVLIITTLTLVFSSGAAMADTLTKPYLKAFGSDVMTGGWFYNGTNCSTDPSSNYQDKNFTAPGFTQSDNNGGIMTYTKQGGTAAGGDSSQYGAYSLGAVDDTQPGYGFYSDGAMAAVGSSSVKALTFANTSGAFGGAFEGSIRQSSCIPDYYSKKPANTTAAVNLAQVISNGKGNYSASPAPGTNFALTTGSAATVPAGTRITLYVNGDVYIDSNIVYDPASTVDNVPKFALIVKGSIYIDKGVTRLDGMYVAQPAKTTTAAINSDDGIIWTCHPNNQTKLDYTYPPNCSSPLVVNGALIAKQVNFFRVHGDISTANTAEDSLGTVNNCMAGACNLSEAVNYTPAMVMGGDFFSATNTTSNSGLPIDSLISLPPVF